MELCRRPLAHRVILISNLKFYEERELDALRHKRMELCVSVLKLTQRHKGTEAQSLTFLTGLTGLTRLGN